MSSSLPRNIFQVVAALVLLQFPVAALATTYVKEVKITVKTVLRDFGGDDPGTNGNTYFKIYDTTGGDTLKINEYLDTPRDDLEEEHIEEFYNTQAYGNLIWPDHFDKLTFTTSNGADDWYLGGFKVEIQVYYSPTTWSTYWKTIYINRGVNTWVTSTSPYSTERANSGSEYSYNDDHEVFWLIQTGWDAVDDADTNLEVSIGEGSYTARATEDVYDSDIWESSPLDDTYSWFWFWSKYDGDDLDAVDKARIELERTDASDNVDIDSFYVNAMQSWIDVTWSTLRTRKFYRENMLLSSSNMHYDTTSSSYENRTNSSQHAESWMDTEAEQNQYQDTCGAKAVEMVMLTRGFNQPSGSTIEQDVVDSVLSWGRNTMCDTGHTPGQWDYSCGWSSSSEPGWWDTSNCVWNPSNGAYCLEKFFFDDSDDPIETYIAFNGDINFTLGDDLAGGGINQNFLVNYLEDEESGTSADYLYDEDCNAPSGFIDPDSDTIGGRTVNEALDVGYAVIIATNSTIDGCNDTHYAVVAGYEELASSFVYFINDPNGLNSGGADYSYEGVDRVGYDDYDFEHYVSLALIWDYDHYE